MGPPIKIDVNGKPVFICCEGCRESLLEEPEKYLTLLANRKPTDNSSEDVPEINLPPMGLPEIVEPEGNVPPLPEGDILPMPEVDLTPTAVPGPTFKRSTKAPPPPSRPTKRTTDRSEGGVQ